MQRKSAIGSAAALFSNQGGDLGRDSARDGTPPIRVTGTVGSALRIYREEKLSGANAKAMPRLNTPVAYAVFPKEFITAPYAWANKAYNIVQRTEMPAGGHFAALEQPDLLLRDVRTFFAKINASAQR